MVIYFPYDLALFAKLTDQKLTMDHSFSQFQKQMHGSSSRCHFSLSLSMNEQLFTGRTVTYTIFMVDRFIRMQHDSQSWIWFLFYVLFLGYVTTQKLEHLPFRVGKHAFQILCTKWQNKTQTKWREKKSLYRNLWNEISESCACNKIALFKPLYIIDLWQLQLNS